MLHDMYREPVIRELHMQGEKLSTICNNRERHTTSTKARSHTEIENRISDLLNMHMSSSME